jgi:hypothetical protein
MSPKLKYWYVQTPDGEKIGPYDQHELRELLEAEEVPLTVGIRTRNEARFIPAPLHPQGVRFLSEEQIMEGRRLCHPPVPEVVVTDEFVAVEEGGETPAETTAEPAAENVPAPTPEIVFSPRLQAPDEATTVSLGATETVRMAGTWVADRTRVARARVGTLMRLRQSLLFCVLAGSALGILIAFIWLRYPSSTQLIIASVLGAFAGWFSHDPDRPRPARARANRPPAPENFKSVQDLLDFNARCEGQEVVRERRRKQAKWRPKRRVTLSPVMQFFVASLVINSAVAAVYLPLAWKMHFAFPCTFEHYLKVALTFGAWDPMVPFVYAAVILLNTAAAWIIFVVNGRV